MRSWSVLFCKNSNIILDCSSDGWRSDWLTCSWAFACIWPWGEEWRQWSIVAAYVGCSNVHRPVLQSLPSVIYKASISARSASLKSLPAGSALPAISTHSLFSFGIVIYASFIPCLTAISLILPLVSCSLPEVSAWRTSLLNCTNSSIFIFQDCWSWSAYRACLAWWGSLIVQWLSLPQGQRSSTKNSHFW